MKLLALSAIAFVAFGAMTSASASDSGAEKPLNVKDVVVGAAGQSCTDLAKRATLLDFAMKHPGEVNAPVAGLTQVNVEKDPQGVGGDRIFVEPYFQAVGGANGVGFPASIAFEVKQASPCSLVVLDIYNSY